MPRAKTATEWARRRRRGGTALIVTGPCLMAAGIVATGVTEAVDDSWFFGFLFIGAFVFISGITTRLRADPVFAPPRLQDLDTEEPNGPDDGVGRRDN